MCWIEGWRGFAGGEGDAEVVGGEGTDVDRFR